jgi:galactokinase
VTQLMPRHVVHSLLAHGLPEPVAVARASDIVRADAILTADAAAPLARTTLWVPGRIEVFGKHTDYAGGRSLVIATGRGFVWRVAPRTDRVVRVWDLANAVGAELPLAPDTRAPEGHWSNYIATVIRRITRNFAGVTHGADLVFHSDLPPASGASSSSALLIGAALALLRVNRIAETALYRELFPDAAALATYCGAIEMGAAYRVLRGDQGVGTQGGCQDQTAILCATRDAITDVTWLPTHLLGAYALPPSLTFVVGASGVTAEKSAGALERYNQVSSTARTLLALWNANEHRDDHSLGTAVQSSPDAPDRLRAIVRAATTDPASRSRLGARLEHFLLETFTLIPAAADAMATGRWDALGDLSRESHAAADRWLGNQVDETNTLVALAREHGALAASAFGAGFGGSVWALVERDRQEVFTDRWADAYRARFPRAGAHAIFFATRPGAPAGMWQELTDVA